MARNRDDWERGRDGKIVVPIDRERERDAFVPAPVVFAVIALALIIFNFGGC
jgi:hypothetical protein